MKAITVIPYLDDLLFIAGSYQQLEKDLQEVQVFLRALGWLINKDESHLVLTQEVQYLGYTISSVERKVRKVFLTQEKIRKMDQAVARLQTNREVLIREVMKVVGLMTSCFLAVPWAIFHQHPLQSHLLRLLGWQPAGAGPLIAPNDQGQEVIVVASPSQF